MPHLLIIEDDPDLGPLLKLNLEREGYLVTLASNGRYGLDVGRQGIAHLIILDLMLPMMDGLQILTRLREEGIETPVLILTARGTEADRIAGFRTGCDDYVTKPFSLMELIARVRALLKRSGHQELPSAVYSGDLAIDPEARRVTHQGLAIKLTPKEFELLYELASHPGQALSRTHLLDEIWGEESEVTLRTVDNHIASLRKKLEVHTNSGSIETVYKLGYRWAG